MKGQKGQSAQEALLLTISVALVLIAAVGLLGDSLSEIFINSDKVVSTFKDSRTSISIDNSSLLTNTKITLGGESYSSPLETIVKNKLATGDLIETNGATGNIREYLEVFQGYISQLDDIIKKESFPSQNEVSTILLEYSQAIEDYTAKDDTLVYTPNDPLLKTINDLDIALDLHKEGELAEEFRAVIDKMLAQYPDGTMKNLIEIYSNDILRFGEKINYMVDSRVGVDYDGIFSEFLPDETTPVNLKSKFENLQSITKTIVEKYNNDFVAMCDVESDINDDCVMNEFKAHYETTKTCLGPNTWDNCMPPLNEMSYFNGNKVDNDFFSNIDEAASFVLTDGSVMTFQKFGSSSQAIGLSSHIWIDTNGANIGPNTVGKDFVGFSISTTGELSPIGAPGEFDEYLDDCNPAGKGYTCSAQTVEQASSQLGEFDTLKALHDEVVRIRNDQAISTDYKASLAKKINVYRDGTYADIFPDSFNSEVLCRGIGASIADSQCKLK